MYTFSLFAMFTVPACRELKISGVKCDLEHFERIADACRNSLPCRVSSMDPKTRILVTVYFLTLGKKSVTAVVIHPSVDEARVKHYHIISNVNHIHLFPYQ